MDTIMFTNPTILLWKCMSVFSRMQAPENQCFHEDLDFLCGEKHTYITSICFLKTLEIVQNHIFIKKIIPLTKHIVTTLLRPGSYFLKAWCWLCYELEDMSERMAWLSCNKFSKTK